MRTSWAVVLAAGALVFGSVVADPPPTPSGAASGPIPVADFARKPDITDLSISPRGDYVAARVMGEEGAGLAVLKVPSMKVLSKFAVGNHIGIGRIVWANPERVVLEPTVETDALALPYSTGELFAIDADGGHDKYLFGWRGGGETGSHLATVTRARAFAHILRTLPEDGDHLIAESYDFSHDADHLAPETVRIDVNNGFIDHRDVSPVEGAGSVGVDRGGALRFASAYNGVNVTPSLVRKVPGAEWAPLTGADGQPEHARLVDFARDGKTAWLVVEGAQSCLVEQNLETGARTPLRCVKDDEIGHVVFAFDDSEPIAVETFTDKPGLVPLKPEHPDWAKLSKLAAAFPGERVRPISATTDGVRVIVLVSSDRDPGAYYLFNTKTLKADFLLGLRDWLDPARMGTRKWIRYKARDGQEIEAVLTLPPGTPPKKLPLVTLPHGGPFGIADDWYWDEDAQLLASHGYAVLQPNFRGSGGRGEPFVMAGKRGWDSVMIDDITDATRWAVAQGIADPQRLCIFGASYGGFAALTSVEREPDLYHCAVGYAGVYDLQAFRGDADVGQTKFGRSFIDEFVGATPERLRASSPIAHLDRIKAALFLAHGESDERAPWSQALATHRELERLKIPHRWLAVGDEGHGFYRENHRERFFTQLLEFLDQQIGSASTVAASAAN